MIIAVDRVTSVRQKLKRCSATRPRRTKNWAKPEITLREMVSEMVANDLEAAKNTLC
ncbi:hypothetical protein O5478_18185 [Escherichia coli]|nr:hypothetical protein [Escherichia coli]